MATSLAAPGYRARWPKEQPENARKSACLFLQKGQCGEMGMWFRKVKEEARF
jgi:hypothetical protein